MKNCQKNVGVAGWMVMVAVVGIFASAGMVQADEPEEPTATYEVYTEFHEGVWIPSGGDIISGTVTGIPENYIYVDSYLDPLPGARIEYTASPGESMTWLNREAGTYYNSSPGGVVWSPMDDGKLGGVFQTTVEHSFNYQPTNLPITIERIVSNPILTSNVQTQSVTVNVTVNSALPAGTNYFSLYAGSEYGGDGIDVDVTVQTMPGIFSGDGGSVSTSDLLVVGQTYQFTYDAEVTRTGSFADQSVYHKPQLYVQYSNMGDVEHVESQGMTLTSGSGAILDVQFGEEAGLASRVYDNEVGISFAQNLDTLGWNFNTSVPEPGGILMFVVGGLSMVRRRRVG